MWCWYCHWGWPKQVKAIYDKYVAVAGEDGMSCGPAHIVWEDENFGREHVERCLREADTYRQEGATDEEHEAVKQSLRDLLELPDEVRDPAALVYVDREERPEQYPPPPGVEMVQKW